MGNSLKLINTCEECAKLLLDLKLVTLFIVIE